MKLLNDKENEKIQINHIDEEKQFKHCEQLWYNGKSKEETIQQEALGAIINRKTIDMDGMNAELLKCDRLPLHRRLIRLYNKRWKNCTIPDS